jgi:signal transduction histidine kinase
LELWRVSRDAKPTLLLLAPSSVDGPWRAASWREALSASHEAVTERDALRRRLERAQLQASLSLEMAQSCSLPEMLDRVARRIAEAYGVQRVALWLLDEGEDRLELRGEIRVGPHPQARLLGEILERVAHEVRSRQRRLLLENLAAEPRYGWDPAHGPATLLAEPMMAHGSLVGVLALCRWDGRALDEETTRGLRWLVSQVALVVKNALLQEGLRAAQDRLREVERILMRSEKLAALGEMSARMAHEIRNPLAAIGGMARRLVDKLPEEDRLRETAEIILSETRRLEDVLGEYLDMARLSQPRRTRTDLNAVARDALDLMRGELNRAGIILEESYARDMPTLLLDGDKIKQALLNILKNALDGVEAGDTIRVETRREGDQVVLEVANTGERIPGEILDKLFVPFVSGKPHGTGLGLAISQQIIQEHGGQILVRSDETWSVVFSLTFPIRENQDRRAGERRSGRDRRHVA